MCIWWNWIGGYKDLLKMFVQMIFTVAATFWICVVYFVRSVFEDTNSQFYENYKLLIFMVFIPVLLSAFSLLLSKKFSDENMTNIKSFSLADNEFLPVYLGYFFVGLSINSFEVLVFIYALMLVFAYLSKSNYFNPLFILFGFHFYHIETIGGSRIFLIKKGKVSKSSNEIENLKRINDNCFISFMGGSK